MRCLWVAMLIGLALATASPAAAGVARDGRGLGLADDTYFGFPDGPQGFRAAAEAWYGRPFAALRPKAFRFQILWNADPALIGRAAQLADYVRSQGVEQVSVTFKKNGPAPDPGAYGASVRAIIGALADRVDAWGPANEPNVGDSWLPGTDGARALAAYWSQFSAAVDALDPSALKLSPEFADRRDLSSIGPFLDAYREAGGGFGDAVGWHPYWGTYNRSRATTDDLLAHVPAGLPVWITEVGGFRTNTHGDPAIHDDETTQNTTLDWLVNDPRGLAHDPRVTHIDYYHVRDTGQPDWDSALVRRDGRPRPAWFTYCAAAHDDDGAARDCLRDYEWSLRNSNSAGPPDLDFRYGHPGLDRPVVGDWNGDGTDTAAVYRRGTWHLRDPSDTRSAWSPQLASVFGYLSGGRAPIDVARRARSEIPLEGDWDGDGTRTPGVYRPQSSEFLLRNSHSCCGWDVAFQYGSAGDAPVVGDWNGDGVDTVGVLRVAP